MKKSSKNKSKNTYNSLSGVDNIQLTDGEELKTDFI